jgi:hypothetical protein
MSFIVNAIIDFVRPSVTSQHSAREDFGACSVVGRGGLLFLCVRVRVHVCVCLVCVLCVSLRVRVRVCVCV